MLGSDTTILNGELLGVSFFFFSTPVWLPTLFFLPTSRPVCCTLLSTLTSPTSVYLLNGEVQSVLDLRLTYKAQFQTSAARP